MDDKMVSSSSSSSLVSTAPLTIHNKLQSIIQNQQRCWNHAIYWQTCRNDVSNSCDSSSKSSLSLVWRDGYFQSVTSPSTHQPNNKFFMDDEGLSMDDIVSDAEWFYIMSCSRWYSLEQTSGGWCGTSLGVLADACMSNSFIWLCGVTSLSLYNCQRTKEANSHGLQTLVCIPVPDGVLELGSGEVIHEDQALIQQVLSLFSPDIGSIPLGLGTGTSFDGSGLVGAIHANHVQPSYLSLLEDSDSNEPISQQRIGKKRGRKPASARDKKAAMIQHVESERQRRVKMSSRFCDLRAVVPKVSKMDKTSLLADAVVYIKELKDEIAKLESQLKAVNASNGNPSTSESSISSGNINGNCNNKIPLEVDVRVLGDGATIRVRCENVNCPPARLMDVLTQLNLQVYLANVSTFEEQIIQDIVILKVPEELKKDDLLKVAITNKLEQ